MGLPKLVLPSKTDPERMRTLAFFVPQMGNSQNSAPNLVPVNISCRNIAYSQEGPRILRTTQMLRFQVSTEPRCLDACRELSGTQMLLVAYHPKCSLPVLSVFLGARFTSCFALFFAFKWQIPKTLNPRP